MSSPLLIVEKPCSGILCGFADAAACAISGDLNAALCLGTDHDRFVIA
jgi:hypothetical protein